MRGPFPLKPSQINIRIPATVRGVFCLGRKPDQVTYVGRADVSLRNELLRHQKTYLYFWYENTLGPTEGYNTHCRIYHKHMEEEWLQNRLHPVPRASSYLKCPVCDK